MPDATGDFVGVCRQFDNAGRTDAISLTSIIIGKSS
jgi:hypothetical protein